MKQFNIQALLAAFAVSSASASALYYDFHQQPLSHDDADLNDNADHHDEHSWWENLRPSMETVDSIIEDTNEFLTSGLDKVAHAVEEIEGQVQDQLAEAISSAKSTVDNTVEKFGGHDHDLSDKTIYELISFSKYTTKFAELVDEYPDLVKRLNSTKAKSTLFVPLDSAFERIPEHHKKPSKEFVEALLEFHVGDGIFPSRQLLSTHTLPTALDDKFLGGEPQRLRISVGFTGLYVNFYSKVVVKDIEASNGVIHGLENLLVPPPFIGRILTLFPTKFSTVLLAYEKTDFTKYIHGLTLEGVTTFAPTNDAFARLGFRTNAFLFNTECGLKYLKAILKYHIAPNATLYSDAFYDKTGKSDLDTSDGQHYELKTLLPKGSVGVDITTYAGFQTIRVNGFARVTVGDVISANGVIHVLDKVLIPPHKDHKHGKENDEGEIEVEDLMDRFESYLD